MWSIIWDACLELSPLSSWFSTDAYQWWLCLLCPHWHKTRDVSCSPREGCSWSSGVQRVPGIQHHLERDPNGTHQSHQVVTPFPKLFLSLVIQQFIASRFQVWWRCDQQRLSHAASGKFDQMQIVPSKAQWYDTTGCSFLSWLSCW